jgi:hypothetical protein
MFEAREGGGIVFEGADEVECGERVELGGEEFTSRKKGGGYGIM